MYIRIRVGQGGKGVGSAVPAKENIPRVLAHAFLPHQRGRKLLWRRKSLREIKMTRRRGNTILFLLLHRKVRNHGQLHSMNLCFSHW